MRVCVCVSATQLTRLHLVHMPAHQVGCVFSVLRAVFVWHMPGLRTCVYLAVCSQLFVLYLCVFVSRMRVYIHMSSSLFVRHMPAGKFTYLDCVIRESLRLYPPSGEALYRRTTARVPLANGRYKLPRGTHVWVHTYAMQRSIHNWTNGADFDPTRWTDKDTNSNSKKSEKTAASKAGKGKTAAGAGKASDDAGGGSQGTKGYDGMASSEDVCAAAGYLSGDVEAAGGPDAGPGPQRCNKRAFMPFGAGERGCLGQAFAQVRGLHPHASVVMAQSCGGAY